MKLSTLCYIENNGKFLMLYRNKKKNDENCGKWIGIGGKLEEGESPDDCLIREVYEETGITLSDFTLRGIITFVSDKFGTEYMFLYTAGTDDTQIRECDEGELKWIDKSEIMSLPMWEGDKLFLEKIRDNGDFFSMKLIYSGDKLISAVIDGTTRLF